MAVVAGGMSRGRSGLTLPERSAAAGVLVPLEQVRDGARADVGAEQRRRPVVSDGAVGYQKSRNECSSGGAPVGLTEAQLGTEPVHRGPRSVAVFAWVPWTDGQYHAVKAFAGEWTSSAVHLRWRESTEGLRDVWVWAAGVRRRAGRRGRDP